MTLDWNFIVLLLIFGIFVGAISTILGEGGGVWYVSFMNLILLFPINISIDTSNFIILLTSGAGFLSYLKDKRINLKLTAIYSSFSILGSLTSTLLHIFLKVNNFLLKLAFVAILIIIALNLIAKSIISRNNSELSEKDKNEVKINDFFEKFDYTRNLKIAIPIFFLSGFISNLLGVGGGIINAPVLNLVQGFPIHDSTSISTSIVFFTAIYNTISKFLFGHIDVFVGILLGVGSIFGAVFGAKISKMIPKLYLQVLLAIVLIGSGIMMIL